MATHTHVWHRNSRPQENNLLCSAEYPTLKTKPNQTYMSECFCDYYYYYYYYDTQCPNAEHHKVAAQEMEEHLSALCEYRSAIYANVDAIYDQHECDEMVCEDDENQHNTRLTLWNSFHASIQKK